MYLCRLWIFINCNIRCRIAKTQHI